MREARMFCVTCGFTVNAVTENQYYVFGECGVPNVCIVDTPVSRCPTCYSFLGVEIWAMLYLHSALYWAIYRKRSLTEAEKKALRRIEFRPKEETKQRWWYRRRGQLIELYRTGKES